MRDASETWGEKMSEESDWKKKVGVKRRGMERRCESQGGLHGGGSWGEGKIEMKVKKAGRCARLPPFLFSFSNSFLLRSTFISRAECGMPDSLLPIRLIPAAARLAPRLRTCTWNQVMCADLWWADWNRPERGADISRHQHHQLAVKRNKTHPSTIKAFFFRSDWKWKKKSRHSTIEFSHQEKIQKHPLNVSQE